jgi:phosphopantothenoylcysteine decarboxylase/phosphopantothenate--cysteine ligase
MRSRKKRHRLNFLITAGGTREYIDPVRFISNASSGKMGYELARAAAAAGHKVTLITAPANLPLPKGVETIEVESAGKMFEAVKSRFATCDCLIMAAAVSDYAPVKTARLKMKKREGAITLKLKPTPDILNWAGNHKRKEQIVIGFALEDKNLRSGAERKLRQKNLDMVVANTPAAIGSDDCEVFVKITGKQWQRIALAPKRMVARRLITLIQSLMPKSSLVNSDSNL